MILDILNTDKMLAHPSAIYKRVRLDIVISISRNGLLNSRARFVIERSEIRKKQHDFKSVHFECRMAVR